MKISEIDDDSSVVTVALLLYEIKNDRFRVDDFRFRSEAKKSAKR